MGDKSVTTMSDVTVVIPTVGRHSLRQAVVSALKQHHPVREVLVCADTLDEIAIPDDPRVRVLRVGPGAGGNAARQAGVEAATSHWIALLDDDDHWSDDKLEKQFALLGEGNLSSIVSSRVVDTDGIQRPVVVCSPNEDPAEYILQSRSVRDGRGKLHTSSLVFPRHFAEAVPFTGSIRFHQDLAWIVRVSEKLGPLSVLQHPEALVVCEPSDNSVSRGIGWRQSVDWCRSTLGGVSARARGDFLLTTSLRFALRNGSLRESILCFALAFRLGSPGVPAVVAAVLHLARSAVHRAYERLQGRR